jgi:hypothetical protein
VKCAVMGSGAVALWQFASGFISPDVYERWEDPVQTARQIGNVSTRYYVIAGEGDRRRPPEYQRLFAQALADKGLNVRFALIRKPGDPHDVVAETLQAADACGQDRDPDLRDAIALGEKVPLPESRTRYGRLGVRIDHVSSDIAARVGLASPHGALILDVGETGAAKPAGVQIGDVIIAIDGKAIDDARDVPKIVSETPTGKSVSVTVVRNGQEVHLIVRLDASPLKPTTQPDL